MVKWVGQKGPPPGLKRSKCTSGPIGLSHLSAKNLLTEHLHTGCGICFGSLFKSLRLEKRPKTYAAPCSKDIRYLEHIDSPPKDLNVDGDKSFESLPLYQSSVSVLPAKFKFLEFIDML